MEEEMLSVSGPEAVARLFEELAEAICVTYPETRTRRFVLMDLKADAEILVQAAGAL